MTPPLTLRPQIVGGPRDFDLQGLIIPGIEPRLHEFPDPEPYGPLRPVNAHFLQGGAKFLQVLWLGALPKLFNLLPLRFCPAMTHRFFSVSVGAGPGN